MKTKSYHILYRLFAFLADKTNGFSFFVKYKLALGTLILSVSATSCAKKQSTQDGDDKKRRDTKGYVTCYEIFDSDSLVKSEDDDLLFIPPEEPYIPSIPDDIVLCYDIALPEEGEVDSSSIIINEPTYCYMPTPNPEMIPEKVDTTEDLIKEADSLKAASTLISCYFVIVESDFVDDQVSYKTTESKIYNYGINQEAPIFQNGTLLDFIDWVKKNMNKSVVEKFQKEDVECKVVVLFIVNEKGEVKDVKTLRGVSPSIDKEVIHTIERSPHWLAGTHLGESVSTRIVITLKFLNGDNTLNE